MNKKISWGAALSLMIIVVAVTVCVTMLVAMRRFNSQVNELSNRQAMYNYVSDVDNAVRQNYYGVIDEEVLRRAMASGEVNGIGDPYAQFLTTEEYSAVQEQLSGQSTGFGLDVALSPEGQVVISAVQKGSTAYSAGLQKGDLITALNKTALGDDPLGTVQHALDSTASLILTINRQGKETAFELSAASFTRISVESSLIDSTGYIRIKSITDATPDQLKSAYSALKNQGAASVVLDLRGNVSGSPEAAKKILSFLLPYGLYGYYADKSGSVELRAEESTKLDMPATVLVNGDTCGEAEMIAAALKQAGLATLVGEPTGGRAKVQKYFALTSDNSAVKITVGEFQLLDKSNWEGHGLTPDTSASLMPQQVGALEILDVTDDAQLQAALAVLNGSNSTVPTAPATEPTTLSGESETTTVDGETTLADTTTTAAQQ